MLLGYASIHESWVGLFPMSEGNSDIVKRSNVLLNYGEKLHYEEGLVYNNFFQGFLATFGLVVLGTCFFNDPLFSFLRKHVLPKPGEGPSKESQENGFLNAVGYGTGSKGTSVKTELYFPHDPAYKSTGRMLAEAGLTLALEQDKLENVGGHLTPASALGHTYLQRLIKTGCQFNIEKFKNKNN